MWKLREQTPGVTRAGSVVRRMQTWFATGELRYIADPDWCDLWGPPSETFDRGGGDCDDLAIVALSMCRFIGLNKSAAVVGLMWQRGVYGWHAWVEGEDDAGWFLIEATTPAILRARPNSYERCYERRYILTPESCVVAPERIRRAA
jgi:transglutaminase-like putative cysteine protease